MGGVTSNLLPGDSELARRAAGGDGAAFVRLFDHYSAEVFEAVLNATGSVERAADATQVAFLRLLRRPPAIDAPDTDVAFRLRTLALGAGSEARPLDRRTPGGAHAPLNAGVGWLRSETVAKAGAHFDRDWSIHLALKAAGAPSAVEAARRWEKASAVTLAEPDAPAAAEPAPAGGPPRRRTALPVITLPRIPLPSAPAMAATLLLLVFAAALAAIFASGGQSDQAEQSAQASAIDMRQKVRTETRGVGAAARAGNGRRSRQRRADGRRPRRARVGDPRMAGERRSGGALAIRLAGNRGVPAPRRLSGRARSAPGGGGTGGETLRRTGSNRPSRGGSDGNRGPATTAPEPAPAPQGEPAPAPAPEPAPAPAAPAPEPAPTRERPPNSEGTPNGGANRNCNSKNSSDPC